MKACYRSITGILCIFFFQNAAALEFFHPVVTSSRGQLEVMKEKVNNEPGSIASQGWQGMLETSYSRLNYEHTPYETVHFRASANTDSEHAFRADGQAARSHALQWVVTGDDRHRQKALTIMKDWMSTFVDWTSNTNAQQNLECAWLLPTWLSTADILKNYDSTATDWSKGEIGEFDAFAKKCYEAAWLSRNSKSNWGVSVNLAGLAYAAYTDDRELFESTLEFGVSILDELSEPDGEIVETCRDTHHPQYSVISWLDAAELANNLGYPDLYQAVFDGQDTPRLALILEYFANLFLGNTDDPCGSGWDHDYEGRYNIFDNYEVGYNHYIYREKADFLPVFRELVEDYWRQDPGDGYRFLLWSRLTHGENDGVLLPVSIKRTSGTSEVSPAAAAVIIPGIGSIRVDLQSAPVLQYYRISGSRINKGYIPMTPMVKTRKP